MSESNKVVELSACVALSVAQAILFFMLGYFGISAGHPHEDAYILFIYSESLANDGLISFYSGGPPAEGATDFLWMILIAGLIAVGFKAAVAALILNAIGVFGVTMIIALSAWQYGFGRVVILLSTLAIASVQFVGAGYVGFSSPLYSFLVLATFVLVVQGDRRIFWVPILSILLGLFRPDGVLLGVGFTVAGFLISDREMRWRYILVSGAAFVVGVGYFLWRYQMFGLLLPLPLYVKSATDGIPAGLSSNVDWAISRLGYLLPAVIGTFAFLKPRKRYLIALLPILLHLALLSISQTSQNAGYRFQAPAGVVVFYLAVLCTAEIAERMKSRMMGFAAASVTAIWAIVLTTAPDLIDWKDRLLRMTIPSYIDTFPMRLASVIDPSDRIALTEAGRFAYFIRNEKVDLVGLNTPQTALNGSDAAFIKSFDPQLLFFHTGEYVDFPCDTGTFCRLDQEAVEAAILQSDIPRTEDVSIRTRRSALSALEHLLADGEDYEVFVALFGRRYDHVYALAKDASVDADLFAAVLEASYRNPREWSYVEGVNRLGR